MVSPQNSHLSRSDASMLRPFERVSGEAMRLHDGQSIASLRCFHLSLRSENHLRIIVSPAAGLANTRSLMVRRDQCRTEDSAISRRPCTHLPRHPKIVLIWLQLQQLSLLFRPAGGPPADDAGHFGSLSSKAADYVISSGSIDSVVDMPIILIYRIFLDSTPKSVVLSALSRLDTEGRIAIVTRREAGRRWPSHHQALLAQMTGGVADGEIVWSWRRDPGAKLAKTLLASRR